MSTIVPPPGSLPPFTIVYQPIYRLTDGQLLSVEALTRFTPTPYRSPDQWFADAWDNGTGLTLELATIHSALTTATDLPATTPIAVNTSPETWQHPDLLDLVTRSPHPVVVELTEHREVTNYPTLRQAATALRRAGARIAVDDTGATTATFTHIRELDPDIIKVDRALSVNVTTHPHLRDQAHQLVRYARNTNTQLIIEGVDRVDDLNTWLDAGADAVQSYLTGRPGPLPVATTSPLLAHTAAA